MVGLDVDEFGEGKGLGTGLGMTSHLALLQYFIGIIRHLAFHGFGHLALGIWLYQVALAFGFGV